MGPPEFTLLAHPRIERDGVAVISPAQPRLFALAAYLAMEGHRPCARGTLAGLLWPDQPEERARHNLRQALSSLRRLLEPDDSPPLLDIRRDTASLLVGAEHIDARYVLRLLDASDVHPHHDPAACAACVARLETVRARYTGPFLDGFSLPDSDLFEEWIATWRERLNERVATALDVLAIAFLRRGDRDQAIQTAHRLLQIDPFHEAAHRHLMRAHALGGNRTAAIRQFATLARVLDDELGVEPEPETIALHDAIRDGTDLAGDVATASQERARPARLPLASTRLVGRERELNEIADLLGHRDCRLLTLHGPGGSGKTRLALEIAHAHADAGGEVVAFIPLAGVTTAEGLLAAIISGLGLVPHGQEPPENQLLAWLRDRPVFLVLDTAEHLAPELGILETLLATAPDLTILTASRERLGLPGEWMYEVPGLAWPRAVDEDSPEGYGAVTLLAERIRQVRAGAAIDHSELPDLVRVCQLVEGMPLALEMAASWATALTPADIAEGIRTSLDFLDASPSPPGTDRHRSMRAVIRSSWDRLPPDLQVTFRRISIFRDGFTLDAAKQVTGASAASLAQLINASLLGHDRTGRYVMHGLLAQFGDEHLRAHEAERLDIVARHARYYLALLAAHERDLIGLDQAAALQAIDTDLANIAAAWEAAIDLGDVPGLLGAAPIMWLSSVLRGRMRAGAATFERLREAFQSRSLPDVAGHDLLAAMTSCYVGGFVSGLGRYDEAISLISTGIAGFRALVSGRSVSVAFNMLAAAELLKGDAATARAHLEESLREAERIQDGWSIAFAVNDLGMVLHRQFGHPNAAAFCERGRRQFQQAGDVRGEGLAAFNLAIISADAGDQRRALALHREALALREAIGDVWGVATSLVQLGQVSASAGDPAAARHYLRRALRIAWNNSMAPVVLEALAELAAIEQDPTSARQTLLAVCRHPAAQDAVRHRCDELLAGIDTPAGDAPLAPTGDVWAIRIVDDLARSIAGG